MDIFESLENLGVSEECFDDIVTMVEAQISTNDKIKAAEKVLPKRVQAVKDLKQKYHLNSYSPETKRKMTQKIPELKRATERALKAFHQSNQPKMSHGAEMREILSREVKKAINTFNQYKPVEEN